MFLALLLQPAKRRIVPLKVRVRCIRGTQQPLLRNDPRGFVPDEKVLNAVSRLFKLARVLRAR